jgi:DNA (cytosine-5)-methyltransferase 1
MNELALFAGNGGGILAAKLLGWRTICAVELETYRAERLAQRQNEGFLPPFPIWSGDIAAFDGRPWRGLADVVSGGFPCQDISGANPNAEGIEGARSGLWKEQRRIVREVEPGFVWVENSPMLTSRGLGIVLRDLAEMGFDAEWGVLGADDLGGFHRRERIFIVGYSDRNWKQQQERNLSESGRRSGNSSKSHALGNTDRAGLQRLIGNVEGDGRQKTSGYIATSGVRVLANSSRVQRTEGESESERKQGGPDSSECGSNVANSNSEQRRTEHELSVSEGDGARQQPSGSSEALENADSGLRDGRPGNEGRESQRRIALRRGGPDCVWGDAEAIECQDGKLRATKPGLCGMAHGVANRVDRISAVGDGQVPVVVAGAWMMLNEFFEKDSREK